MMDIERIRELSQNLPDLQLKAILGLILDAMTDMPDSNYETSSEFFNKIKVLISNESLSVESLSEAYALTNDPWIGESINSLIEAFELMKFYKISLDKILEELSKLEG